jgi:hypothetical protein
MEGGVLYNGDAFVQCLIGLYMCAYAASLTEAQRLWLRSSGDQQSRSCAQCSLNLPVKFCLLFSLLFYLASLHKQKKPPTYCLPPAPSSWTRASLISISFVGERTDGLDSQSHPPCWRRTLCARRTNLDIHLILCFSSLHDSDVFWWRWKKDL